MEAGVPKRLVVAGHHFLSADEVLSELNARKGQRVPALGDKFSVHEHAEDWRVTADVNSYYAARHCLLSEEKIEKSSRLGEGVWQPGSGLVRLTKALGRAFQRFGHVRDGAEVLYPEEALFLMETRHLIVNHHGLPLSVQEAYKTFLKSEFDINAYHVYSHLRRLGFVVMRHSCRDVISGKARQISKQCSDNSSVGVHSTEHGSGRYAVETSDAAYTSTCSDGGDSAADIADSINDSTQSVPFATVGSLCASLPELLGHDQGSELIPGLPSAEKCMSPEAIRPSPEGDSCETNAESASTHSDKNLASKTPSPHHLVDGSHGTWARPQPCTLVEPSPASEHSSSTKRPHAFLLERGTSCQLAVHTAASTLQVQPAHTDLDSPEHPPATKKSRTSQLEGVTPGQLTAGNLTSATLDSRCPPDQLSSGITASAKLTVPYYCCTDFDVSASCFKRQLLPSAVSWDFTDITFPGSKLRCDQGVLGGTVDNGFSYPPSSAATLSPSATEILSSHLPSVEDMIHVTYDVPGDFDSLEESVLIDLPSWWPHRCLAKTWPELKTEVLVQKADGMDSRKSLASLTDTDVPNDSLATEAELRSLVRSGETYSYKMILSKLDIIRHWSGTKSGILDNGQSTKIIFDVFKPGNCFRKSSPGPPHLQVCIASAGDVPPVVADLSGICCGDTRDPAVDLCWAVVDNGSVSCYILTSPFTLPDPLES